MGSNLDCLYLHSWQEGNNNRMVAVKCQEQNCATKTREQLKKRLKRITENQSLSVNI